MQKIYTILIALTLVAGGCSKDFLKSYEDRIVGTWNLTDVDHRGIGEDDRTKLPFTSGIFVFSDGGQLTYTSILGTVYNGSWGIDEDYIYYGNTYDENGNVQVNDDRVWRLDITAIAFSTQEVRSEHFDEIRFSGTNSFKAFIRKGLHTYVFYFERE